MMDENVQAVSPDSPGGPVAVVVEPDPHEKIFEPPVDPDIYDDTLDREYVDSWRKRDTWDGIDPAEVMAAREGVQPEGEQFKSFAKEGENTLVQQTDAIEQERAKQEMLQRGEQLRGMVEMGMDPKEAETQLGGLETPLYDPVDIFTDVVTGGLAPMARAGFKAGGKAGAKLVAKSIAEDVVLGAVAGGFMATTEELGPFVQTVSGVLGVPLTMALVSGGRKAFAGFLKKVSTDNKPLYEKMVKVFEESGDGQGAEMFRQLLREETDAVPVGMSIKDVSGEVSGKKIYTDGDESIPTDVGTLKKDANSDLVYELEELDPNALKISEPEGDIKKDPSFAEYVKLAKEGSEPPPITVNQSWNGKDLVSVNRRRVLAAQEAGVTKIKAWVNRLNPDGSPMKVSDLEKGKRVADPSKGKITTYMKLVQEIDKNSEGALDLKALKKKLGASEYYQFMDIDVDSIPKSQLEGIDPKQAKTGKGHVVIDENGEIIDGRHRIAAAIANGEKTVKAYVPIEPPTRGKTAAEKVAKEAKTSFDEIMQSIDETAEELIQRPSGMPGEKFAGNINLSKVDTPEDVKALVEEVAKKFSGRTETARRGIQTEADIKALADDLGMDEKTLLKRGMGEAYNAEQLLAARHIVWQSANTLSSMAKMISQGDNSANMMAAFKVRVAKHAALQLQLSGATAEAGRALRQQQIVATGAAARMQEISDMVAAGGSVGVGEMSDRLARQMARGLADMDAVTGGKLTVAQANTFIRQASKATTFDMLTEAWINGLLSGPVTHATNALSNALVTVWQIPERALASMVSSIPGVGSGQIAPQEVLSQVYGMVKGFEDGMRLAKYGAMDVITLRKLGVSAENAARKQAIKEGLTGEAIETRITEILNSGPGYKGDSLTKINEGRYESISAKNMGLENTTIGRGMDLLGEFVRGPGKALQVGDDLFKAIHYREGIHTQAIRKARNEGLTGEEFASRVRELVANPNEDISMEAMRNAREQTFTNDMGKVGKWIQQGTNRVKFLRLIFPFVRTPVQVVNYALKRNVVTGPFYREMREALKQGGAARDLAIAKMGLGSAVMLWAGQQTFAGNITGSGPAGRAKREAWLAAGNQPYSFKNPLTGEWISYGRLEPIGSMFGIAASAAEIIAMSDDEDVDAEEIMYAALGGVAKNITSKMYLRGISEFMEAFSSPEQHMATYIQGFVGTVVPTAVAQINRAFFDPTLRDTRSALDLIKSRIPGLSDNIAPRTDQWGKPITLEGSIGPDILSPLYTKDPQYGSIASQELLRVGYDMPSPQKGQSFDGVSVELNGDQLYRLKQLYGQDIVDSNGLGFEETVEKLATGEHPNRKLQSDYSNATNGKEGGKKFILVALRQWYLSAAKFQLLQEFPEINEKVVRVKGERFDSLTGGGVSNPYSPVTF